MGPHTYTIRPPPPNHPATSSSSDARVKPLPAVILMTCPKCPHSISGTKPAFRLTSLDAKTWCNRCQRSWAISRWQCPCNLPWHTCPTHQGEPDRLRADSPSTTASSTARSTPPAPSRRKALGQGRDGAIRAWLDHPPPKRRRAEPDEVELGAAPTTGVKHHLLGPKLRAKFPRQSHQPGSTTTQSTSSTPPLQEPAHRTYYAPD